MIPHPHADPRYPYFSLFRSSDPLIDFGDKDDDYVDEVHPEEATTTLIPPVGHPFRVARITPRTGPGEVLLSEVGGEAQKLCVRSLVRSGNDALRLDMSTYEREVRYGSITRSASRNAQ